MASAVIGALRVVLGIDTALFDKGLADAQKSLKGVAQSMQSLGKTMSMGLTAPIAAFGALTLRTAGDFEAAMNRVEAAALAPAETVEQLSDLARELGKLGPGAISAAEGIEALIKNGLDATAVLEGAGEATVLLAQAGEAQLGPAADVITDIMAQFKKEASQLSDVVDDVSGTMVASKLDFDGFRLAIGQAGGVAGALGVTFEDFTTTIAAIAPAFASGSDAGTSFKTFLTRLVPQSDAAADKMKELGLEFFDASGNMKSMGAIAQELKEGLAGLSQEARNDALNTIFGQDALRAAIMLGEQGEAGLAKIRGQIDAISAADQAAAKLQGFNGAMKTLSAAFTELQIAIGESGLLEFMAQLVKWLAEWIKSLAQANPTLLKWGTIIAGVAAAIGPLLVGLGLMVSGFAALLPLLAPIGVALMALVSPIGLVVGAFAGIAAAWLYWDEVKAAFPEFGAAVETTVAAVKAYLTGLWEQFKLAGTLIVQVLQGDFAGAFETLKQMFVNVGQTFLNVATTIFPQAVEKIKGIAGQIIEAFKAIPGQMLKIGGDIIDGLWQGIKTKWEEVKGGVRNIFSMIPGMAQEETDTHSPSRVMHAIGLDIMQGMTNGLKAGGVAVLGVARDVSAALVETAKKAPVAAKQTTDAWAGLRGVKEQADDTGNSLGSMFSGFGSSVADLLKGTKSLRDVLADVVGQFADGFFQKGMSALFGGSGGSGGGGFLSSLLGGLLAFSSGGTILPGGAGGIDSQVVAFRKSPNEQVDITKPGQRRSSGGGSQDVVVRGVFVDDGGVIKARIDQTSIQTSQAAVQRYDDGLPARFNDIMLRNG